MVTRAGFLVTTALVPAAVLLFVAGLGVYIVFASGDDDPPDSQIVGYVDLADVIVGPGTVGATEFVAVESDERARAEVAAGTLDAAYVIPPDYLSTGQVVQIIRGGQGISLTGLGSGSFRDFLRANLVADVADSERAARILSPAFISTVEVSDTGDLAEGSFDPVSLDLLHGDGGRHHLLRPNHHRLPSARAQ